MSACSTSPTDQQLAIAGDVATGAAAAGGKYIDTSGWFCYQDVCPQVVGNTIVYTDGSHITIAYATELSAVFRAALRKAIGLPAPPVTFAGAKTAH